MMQPKQTLRHHIRFRLSLVFSLVVGLISLFIYIFFPNRLAQQSFRAYLDKTQSIVRVTSYRIAPALYFEDVTAAEEAVESARQDSDIVYLVVLDDSGRVFSSYNLGAAERNGFKTTITASNTIRNRNILALSAPVVHDGATIGRIFLGMSLAGLQDQVKATRVTTLIVSILVFLAGAIAVFSITTFLTKPLISMAGTVQKIAAGDLTQRAPVSSRDEVGQLAAAFNDMVSRLAAAQQELQEMNRDLESRVRHRTGELAKSEEALRKTSEQLRALNAHLQNVREEERTRVAREIHDELGQMLTALNLDIAVLEKQLTRIAGESGVALPTERVRSISGLVESTIRGVRRLALELRPGILDSLGLVAALEWQAREFRARTGIECESRFLTELPSVDQWVTTAVFRIFQESLTNVARHARASRVEIALEKKTSSLLLCIRDNGIGFDEASLRGNQTIGLLGMRERARALGGDVRITSAPGQGTEVTLHMPLIIPPVT